MLLYFRGFARRDKTLTESDISKTWLKRKAEPPFQVNIGDTLGNIVLLNRCSYKCTAKNVLHYFYLFFVQDIVKWSNHTF